MRELYLYWKLAPVDEVAARAALQAWQQTLCGKHGGLSARVLRRLDSSDATQVTLMEIYVQPPQGVSDAVLRAVREEGDALVKPWCAGQRHLEMFASTAS